MPDLNQDPARLNVRCNQANDLTWYAYFAASIAGYTWDAKVDGTLAINISAVAATDLPAGYVAGLKLVLTDTDTAALTIGTHQWALDRTDDGNARRWIAGDFYIFQYNP